jgi:hypothetical protein
MIRPRAAPSATAQGHLARARRAAGEQQVGHVDAGQQEQQAGRRHHDDQDRPEVADHEATSGLVT